MCTKWANGQIFETGFRERHADGMSRARVGGVRAEYREYAGVTPVCFLHILNGRGKK